MYTRSDCVHHGGDAAVEVLAMVVPWILWLEKNWTVTFAHGQLSLRWTAAFVDDDRRTSQVIFIHFGVGPPLSKRGRVIWMDLGIPEGHLDRKRNGHFTFF